MIVLNPVYLPFAGGGVGPQCESPPELSWKSSVSGVLRLPSYISRPTCDSLLDLSARFPDEPGRMFDHAHARRNRLRVLQYDGETHWVFELMAGLFERANRRFRFELTGFAEPVHVIEYAGGDFIDWHSDCSQRQTSTRKLVATILLSPREAFKGGELEFAAMDAPARPAALGDATVFPAFLPHRVKPVTHGRRAVLAAWAHGPAFC